MFEIQDLNDEGQKEIARIAICQLELNDQLVQNPDRTTAPSDLEKIRRRLKPVLDAMHDHKPDLIQFPELSIPQDLVPELHEQAKALNAIIIAGTHYQKRDEGIISVCPILFPDGRSFFIEKATISPLEKSIVTQDSVIPGNQQYLFRNTRIGNFVVLICSDFMDKDTINDVLSPEFDIDFVFVSSCQGESNRYYAMMSNCCRDSQDGVYFCYANLLWKPYGDGGSAIFGNVDMSFLQGAQQKGITDSKPREKIWVTNKAFDYVVADFDRSHKKAHLSKSVYESPNIQIRARWETDQRSVSSSVSREKYKIVAFDMDGTILRGLRYSWELLWEHCGDNGELWKSYFSQYHKQQITYEEWCNKAISYYEANGLTMDDVIRLAREKCTLTVGFHEGVARLKAAGLHLGLVSGGVDLFLKATVPDYRDIFDFVHVNKLLLDGDGRVCGVVPTKYDYDGKATALEEMCDAIGCELEQSIFVGDRFNDKKALEKAGLSIVYSESEDVVGEVAHHKITTDDFGVLVDLILAQCRTNY